jgi:hypothetical protein
MILAHPTGPKGFGWTHAALSMIKVILLLTLYTAAAVGVLTFWVLMTMIAHDICRTIKERWSGGR